MDSTLGKIKSAYGFCSRSAEFMLVRSTLSVFVILALIMNARAQQNESLDFDTSFLKFSDGDASSSFNLDYFSQSGGMLPGVYQVTVYVNDKKVDNRAVEFVSRKDAPGRLQAQVTPLLLGIWGIVPQIQKQCTEPISNSRGCLAGDKSADIASNTNASLHKAGVANKAGLSGEDKENTASKTEQDIRLLSDWVPQSKEVFDFQNSTLHITIPQAYIAPPGWLRTPAALWDQGTPALLINYDYSGSSQNNNDGNNRSDFVSLNELVNLWGWRLRHDMNWSKSSGGQGQWNNINTYVQHDYAFWQGGQLTLGQTSTDGSILDSVPFEGVMLQSDDTMLNSEMGIFAPVIRGIANSNAVVSVRQNGTLLYQKSVPPGPFELRDFAQSYSGDVDIEIKEADGTKRHFTQASATVPVLLRKGRVRYNVAMGRYHQGDSFPNDISKNFVLGSMAWGIGNNSTLYGGLIAAENYYSAALGLGQYLPVIGAFSFDITQASAKFSNHTLGNQQGQAYRFSYARGFGDTSLSLVAYRYATKGYYTFNDVQQINTTLPISDDTQQQIQHQRSRVQISLSQNLGEYGSISISGSRDNYWDRPGYGQNWSTSYGTNIRGVSVSLSAGYSTSPDNLRPDKTFSINLSIPMNKLPGGVSSVNYTTTAQNSNVQHQVGLSGSLLDDNRLNYSVSQGWGNQGQGASGNANLGYTATYGVLNGGYGYQRNSRQWNYGMSGGVVVHPHGVTLSQPLSLEGASALVEIPGASGVKISGRGVSTDWFGYAVVPNLIPYTRNDISADVQDLADDVEISDTNKILIPAKGALVAAKFNAQIGRRVLISLLYGGKPLPFGAMVSVQLPQAIRTGIVADKGQVYLAGMPDEGSLIASWGTHEDERCKANFTLPKDDGSFTEITTQCQ